MQGIRNIVRTMKTLSVINAATYEHAARTFETYHDTVLTGLHAFLSKLDCIEITSSNPYSTVFIVSRSDHGLCGTYNDALARHVAEQLGYTLTDATVLCVGAQMADALHDSKLSHSPCSCRLRPWMGLLGWPTF